MTAGPPAAQSYSSASQAAEAELAYTLTICGVACAAGPPQAAST